MKRSIDIIDAGAHTTIQDLGRPGRRSAGVSVGGAVDPISLRIANLLVGNDESAAAIECALIGPTIRFNCECAIALCGARSMSIPISQTIHVRARQSIRLGSLTKHTYGYLAVSGGIDLPGVLGSRGTDTRVGIGGVDGRRLVVGDSIAIGLLRVAPSFGTRVNAPALIDSAEPIRIIAKDDSKLFDSAWMNRDFRISSKSDRMGVRLECSPIAGETRANAESTIVLPGTIQLPPNGEPIVLLADAQTLGGYPQIGHVITADLPKLAQCPPGSMIRFVVVTLDEAHRQLQHQARELALLRYGLTLRK